MCRRLRRLRVETHSTHTYKHRKYVLSKTVEINTSYSYTVWKKSTYICIIRQFRVY